MSEVCRSKVSGKTRTSFVRCGNADERVRRAAVGSNRCCLDQQPAPPAARHCSLPPTSPPRESVSSPQTTPKTAANWQGRVRKLEGQFEGCRACGKSGRRQLQCHPLKGWKSTATTQGALAEAAPWSSSFCQVEVLAAREKEGWSLCLHTFPASWPLQSSPQPRLFTELQRSCPLLGATWRWSHTKSVVFKASRRAKQPHLAFMSLASYCEQDKGGWFSFCLLSYNTRGKKKRQFILHRKQNQTTTLTWNTLLESWQ